jgi:hypothetical protein
MAVDVIFCAMADCPNVGFFARTRAATPETMGALKDVPTVTLYASAVPPATAVVYTPYPCATTSTHDPRLENPATSPYASVAPTAITPGYAAGNCTTSLPSFPDAATTTMFFPSA